MNITPFNFEENNVRVITDDNGAPWFVASDIATVLEYRDAFNATRFLDDDEKGTQIVSTPSGEQRALVINESGLYACILKSRKAEAKRFKKWVTAEVLPTIRRTGQYNVVQPNPLTSTEADLRIVSVLADMLRVAPSGRLGMAQAVLRQGAPHLLPFVPTYAVDAPSDAASGSSEITHSATHLLRQHGSPVTAQAFNRLAEDAGFLETCTRQSSSGRTKSFWSVTDSGLRYGKNVSSPQSPRETQPHWYDSRFDGLLEELGY